MQASSQKRKCSTRFPEIYGTKNHREALEHFKIDAKDRQYQFWERNPLSVDIWTETVLKQKPHYVHENPVKAGLVEYPIEYLYSSTKYYETGIDD